MKLPGAEVICECLLEQGVDTVFGYPGGAALNTYDALYKYSDKINHIMTAHEQGASHAADGYARASGKVGVVFATSGPGATNLVTGIATANIDSIPLVAITGNVARDLLGRDSFQEVDIVDIVKPVTKASFLVTNEDELAPTIRKAFLLAQTGRKGPVLIDVPKDITASLCEYEKQEIHFEKEKSVFSDKIMSETLELLKGSKRPLIYAGGGIISADASKEFTKFAELLDAPVCCSLMGLGSISASHRLCYGNIGMHGGYETAMATENADLIIACGARFSDRVAGDRERFGHNARIIHLDIDKNEIHKNIKVDNWLVGDIKDSLQNIIDTLPQQNHSDWLSKINVWKEETPPRISYPHEPPTPRAILETINNLKNENDIIATDVGQHQMWVAQYSKIENPRRLLTSGGMGTMGYGMGGAIGGQMASPDSRVILVTGDGSFHMNLNELVTLKSYNIPVIVVVMNNKVLGMVRQWQKLFYGSRFSQTDPHRATDFVAVANSFGIDGMRINTPDEVEEVLAKAFSLNKPVVVDCRISPDENVLPMIPPGKTAKDVVTEM